MVFTCIVLLVGFALIVLSFKFLFVLCCSGLVLIVCWFDVFVGVYCWFVVQLFVLVQSWLVLV